MRSDPDFPGQSVKQHLDRDHRVELQQCQVGEVFVRESIGSKRALDETNTSEAGGTGASRPEVRNVDAVRVTDDDLLDLTAAVDEQTDSPPGIAGELGE